MKNQWKQINWADHVVNFLVVLISISIAFWLDGWRNEAQDRKIEKRSLKSMVSDLDSDISDLDSLIEYYASVRDISQKFLDTTIVIIDYLDTSSFYTKNFYKLFRFREGFVPQNITYESMRNAGNLEIITSQELRAAIVKLNYKIYGLQIRERESFVRKRSDSTWEQISKLQTYDKRTIRHTLRQPEYNYRIEIENQFCKMKEEQYLSLRGQCIALKQRILQEI